nr:immunoglobulin light chain junction region [Macaca mulatta]
CQQAYSNPYSF